MATLKQQVAALTQHVGKIAEVRVSSSAAGGCIGGRMTASVGRLTGAGRVASSDSRVLVFARARARAREGHITQRLSPLK